MDAIEVIGAAMAACGALVVGALLFLLVWALFGALTDKYRRQGEQDGFNAQRRRLADAAAWFSLDPPIQALLVDLAKDMPVWEARDRFEKRRKSGGPDAP